MQEKRIVVRVGEERWRALDDKRHAERTTFQDLGLRLFENWMVGDNKQEIIGETGEIRDSSYGEAAESADIIDTDKPWLKALLEILHSGNEIAAKAIRSNLVAFADYVRAVPDASTKFADITAKTEELATLDRALDSAKATGMASGGTAPPDRKKDARGPGGKRVSTGPAREGMG